MKIIASYGQARSLRTWASALVAAVMITVMLLAQLFEYEDFIVILGALLPVNDAASVKVIAALIIVTELLALPFLLNMYLSKLMRVLSAVMAMGVATFWLFTALTNAHANNSGMFSTTIELQGGLVAAMWALILFGTVAVLVRDETRSRNMPLEKKTKLE
jgi:hypothetical protein